jgi:hypothetical protein
MAPGSYGIIVIGAVKQGPSVLLCVPNCVQFIPVLTNAGQSRMHIARTMWMWMLEHFHVRTDEVTKSPQAVRCSYLERNSDVIYWSYC